MYLIYLAASAHQQIPTLSIILIAAVYGLQALVFVLRRKWDMIGWMVFYIIAIPIFSFFLPLYSFWRMDDFSWGQTRVVLGESGKKMIVHVSILFFFENRRQCLTVVCRTRASSILVPFLSSLGMTTYVHCFSGICLCLNPCLPTGE